MDSAFELLIFLIAFIHAPPFTVVVPGVRCDLRIGNGSKIERPDYFSGPSRRLRCGLVQELLISTKVSHTDFAAIGKHTSDFLAFVDLTNIDVIVKVVILEANSLKRSLLIPIMQVLVYGPRDQNPESTKYEERSNCCNGSSPLSDSEYS